MTANGYIVPTREPLRVKGHALDNAGVELPRARGQLERFVMCVSATAQAGNLSTIGMLSKSRSQSALLDMNMCAVGLINTSLSRLPAGVTNNLPFICKLGSAEPQLEQKLLVCCVNGRVNDFILLSPETQIRWAAEENRLDAWAEPVSLRQYSQ